MDEASLKLHATLTRCWSLRGRQVQVGSWDQHGKTHLFGALDAFSGQVHYCLADRLTARWFRYFLGQLLAHRPDERLVLVVDNAGWHRAKLVQQFLAEHADRLEVLPLPKYAPDLNPIERLWKWMRHRVTHNHCYETMQSLKAAARHFFVSIANQRERVLSYCGL